MLKILRQARWLAAAALACGCTSTTTTTPGATDIAIADAGTADSAGGDTGGTDASMADTGSTDAGTTDTGGDTGMADAPPPIDVFVPGDIVVGPGSGLFLNEIAAQGTPLGAFNPSGGDWVELYNSGTAPLDLQSYKMGGLTKGLAGAEPLPPGTSIPAGGFLIVYFNLDSAGSPVIANKLKADGSMAIWDAGGKMLDQVDWVLADMVKGGSYGRSPDGGAKWKTYQKGQATPAKANLP